MIDTKYDCLFVGGLAAINELSLVKHGDSSDMISVIKVLVHALASALRRVENREAWMADCIQQSIEDLLSCIDSDENPTGALAYIKDELSSALIFSGKREVQE